MHTHITKYKDSVVMQLQWEKCILGLGYQAKHSKNCNKRQQDPDVVSIYVSFTKT